MRKISLAAMTAFSLSTSALAAQGLCENISRQVEKEQAFLNPPESHKVIGEGRLYLYTAPNESCRSKDTFVIPGDTLFAYTEFKGWYSVMYINLKTGDEYHGWVRPERLKWSFDLRPKT